MKKDSGSATRVTRRPGVAWRGVERGADVLDVEAGVEAEAGRMEGGTEGWSGWSRGWEKVS